MTESAAVYKRKSSLWSSFKIGWRTALRYPKVIGLIYGVNLIIAFIAVGPVNQILKNNLGQTVLHSAFKDGYDHTIFMDILNNQGGSISIAIAVLTGFFIPYLLWAVFCAGGMMGVMHSSKSKNYMSDFWQGGCRYFFRYLMLSLGVYFSFISICLCALKGFQVLGINPLMLKTEQSLITRGYLFLGFLILTYAILSAIKEVAKVVIASHSLSYDMARSNFVISKTFSLRSIFLCLVYLLIFIIASFIYFMIKPYISPLLIVAVLIGQVYLLFRIIHRFARFASYYTYISEGQA